MYFRQPFYLLQYHCLQINSKISDVIILHVWGLSTKENEMSLKCFILFSIFSNSSFYRLYFFPYFLYFLLNMFHDLNLDFNLQFWCSSVSINGMNVVERCNFIFHDILCFWAQNLKSFSFINKYSSKLSVIVLYIVHFDPFWDKCRTHQLFCSKNTTGKQNKSKTEVDFLFLFVGASRFHI